MLPKLQTIKVCKNCCHFPSRQSLERHNTRVDLPSQPSLRCNLNAKQLVMSKPSRSWVKAAIFQILRDSSGNFKVNSYLKVTDIYLSNKNISVDVHFSEKCTWKCCEIRLQGGKLRFSTLAVLYSI